ncbi:MAG: hypothetical protein V4643_09265 [Bacteroidota bacterium]
MKKQLGILIFLLVLTCAVGGYFLFENSAKANMSEVDSIVDKQLKAYPNYYTSSDKFTDTLSLAITAMKYYTIGNYNSALDAFQKFEPLEEDDGYYNLYLGICYLKTGYSSLAIRHFDEALSSFTTFNEKTVVRWYLALAMLKSERINEGRELLDEQVKQNTPYKKQATEILNQLD